MIKLCVFDVDGTLMDTLSSISYNVNAMLKELGFEQIEMENFKYFAGNGRTVLIERSLKHIGKYSEENLKKACEVYDSIYEANPMYLTKPFDKMKAEVKKIQDMGMKTAVLSNKPDNVVHSVIENENTFGKDFFEYIRGGIDGEPMKPDAAMLVNVANVFGVEMDEVCMIGDTNVDILTGVNAGAKTIGVLWGFRDEDELRDAGADIVVSTVTELANAVVRL